MRQVGIKDVVWYAESKCGILPGWDDVRFHHANRQTSGLAL